MGRLQIHRRGAPGLQGIAPPRHTKAPAVAGFEPRETPFRMRRYQVIAIQNREIEEIACDLDTDGVQADILRTGASKSVAIKSGHGITATALKLGSQNIGRHPSN